MGVSHASFISQVEMGLGSFHKPCGPPTPWGAPIHPMAGFWASVDAEGGRVGNSVPRDTVQLLATYSFTHSFNLGLKVK